jgi:TRAP-type transport system small permease protein
MTLIERCITALCQGLLWIATSIIFIILAINTVLRYASGSSLQWANEVPELLFPWLVMAGVVLAAQHGAHITTTFLAERLALKHRRLMIFIGWAVVAALYATLALATFRMLGIAHDEKSPILQIPSSVTYVCVMGGMALLSILAVFSAWRVLKTQAITNDGEHPPKAHW